MSAQTYKHLLSRKDFSDIYICLAERHLNYRRFGIGEDINILDFVEVMLSERIDCEKDTKIRNKYL